MVKKVGQQVAIFGIFLAITVLITWPLMRVISSDLFGGFLTDALQTARHVWWIKHALQTGQSIFFQPLFNYPDGLSGAWLWANPLEYFPGWLFAFFLPLNAATNLMLMFHVIMNGWAMYTLVYQLSGKRHWPALLAGVVFLAYPAMQGRIYGGHAGVLALWPLVLYFYAAYRLRDSFSGKYLIIASLFLALSTSGNSTLLVYYTIPAVGCFLVWLFLQRDWSWFRKVVIATALGAALSLIFLIPLALETRNTPTYDVDIGGSVTYSADLLSIVSPSFFHPLYENLDYSRRAIGTNLLEGTGYIGIVAFALALMGAITARQSCWLLWLMLLAWIFSLGPLLKIANNPVSIRVENFQSYIPLPWGFLQSLPILDISRTPGRFNLTIGFAVAILAGYGAVFVGEKFKAYSWRPIVFGVLIAAILFDFQMFWPMPTLPTDVPQAILDLSERDDIRAVLNLPVLHPLRSKDGLYMQAFHQQNIIGGQYVRYSPVNNAKLRLLQNTLDLTLLDQAGVDVILLFKEYDSAGLTMTDFAYAQLGKPTYEDVNIALFEVPESEQLPELIWQAHEKSADTGETRIDFYVPEAGWVNLSIALIPALDSEILLDNMLIHEIPVSSELSTLNVPLFLQDTGFYSVDIRPKELCPILESESVICKGIHQITAELHDFETSEGEMQQVQYNQGITLTAYQVVVEEQTLSVDLAWHFDHPPAENVSRFVHVLDSGGNLVGQEDGPIPLTADDTNWNEKIMITIPEGEEPDEYRVYAGWYVFPSLDRYEVLSDVEGKQDRAALIGTASVP